MYYYYIKFPIQGKTIQQVSDQVFNYTQPFSILNNFVFQITEKVTFP